MTRTKTTRFPHAASALLTAALTLTIALPLATTIAQQQVGSGGHALDANLRLGSGGYNRPVGGGGSFHRRGYQVGSSRAIYTVNRYGGMSYSPHNAFSPRRGYSATGYAGDTSSYNYYKRFRYYGH